MKNDFVEILRVEISQMKTSQIRVFKNELTKTLPPVVRAAARRAKKTSENISEKSEVINDKTV